jgi:hypothetical protein
VLKINQILNKITMDLILLKLYTFTIRTLLASQIIKIHMGKIDFLNNVAPKLKEKKETKQHYF